MPRVQAGEIELGWREWGRGEVTVVFIHGNLASKDAAARETCPVPVPNGPSPISRRRPLRMKTNTNDLLPFGLV